MTREKRYERLKDLLAARIAQGVYRPGDRLPSVRQWCREQGVSMTTAQASFAALEADGLIEARPRSGYFVAEARAAAPAPRVSRPEQRPVRVSRWEQVQSLVVGGASHHVIAHGMPDLRAPTLRPLRRLLATHQRDSASATFGYDRLAGDPALRQQITHLMSQGGALRQADDVIVTTGAQEALAIALRILCQPGDVIAVDSPAFYGAMQMLEARGLQALEIPTDAQRGISLEALELALERWPVKAILITPTCNNPLGYSMPEERKRALLALARRHDVAIIEDDVYGDLAYDAPRPRLLASEDSDGRVLTCSSFSKTLLPGLRLGWLAPGRYRDRALHEKYVSTGCSATLAQAAVAEFIVRGHHARHLAAMRRQYRRQAGHMRCWVQQAFPPGTRVSDPRGGFMLWVELPEAFDSLALNAHLQEHGLGVAPGPLFSASGKYGHCLRLNFSSPMSDSIETAVRTIGRLAGEQLQRREPRASTPA
ncbi:aminotransferase-like domain-containing protein [Halomonas sp. V046]|uniref:aminotransferase-like domain-containing protein n=1 Tax=Halomonas sp. V046 TaxID=3459611 RepID=UPI004044C8D1